MNKSIKKVYTTRMTVKQRERLTKLSKRLKMTIGDTIEYLLDIEKEQFAMLQSLEKRIKEIEKELKKE